MGKNYFGDVALINPRESIKKGELAVNVPMVSLESFKKKISLFEITEYKGSIKFKNDDTTLARITLSLENSKTAYVDILNNDEVGFGSTECIVIREKSIVMNSFFFTCQFYHLLEI